MIEFFTRILLKLLFTLYPLLYKVKEINKPKNIKTTPLIYAHYHGDELVLVPTERHLGVATMSSLSRDGRRMASLLKILGYKVFFGSSSRRSISALLELKNYSQKQPGPISFAVDGPKGPRQEIKPGVFWLSQRTNIPIVFIAVSSPKRFVFRKSWNKTFVPKPLSKNLIVFSNPIIPPINASPSEMAKSCTPWFQKWHKTVLENYDELCRENQLIADLSNLEAELGQIMYQLDFV